jgi:hypothetical protein
MSRKQLCWTVLAAGHLLLVACGAVGLQLLPPASWAGRATGYYGAVSGAASSYGFFAPNVGPQIRATMTVQDAAGRSWRDTLTSGKTMESRLRVCAIPGRLDDLQPEKKMLVMRSLAAAMFGRHPDARQVTIRVELFGRRQAGDEIDFPAMSEVAGGKTPEWIPLYEATFERG